MAALLYVAAVLKKISVPELLERKHCWNLLSCKENKTSLSYSQNIKNFSGENVIWGYNLIFLRTKRCIVFLK